MVNLASHASNRRTKVNIFRSVYDYCKKLMFAFRLPLTIWTELSVLSLLRLLGWRYFGKCKPLFGLCHFLTSHCSALPLNPCLKGQGEEVRFAIRVGQSTHTFSLVFPCFLCPSTLRKFANLTSLSRQAAKQASKQQADTLFYLILDEEQK